MNKKKSVVMRLSFIAAAIVFTILLAGSGFYMNKIQYHKNLTFQDVMKNEKRIKEFGIERGYTPSYYGFPDYTNCEFFSLNSKLRFTGWFIKSEYPSDKSLIIIEGRGVNRLKVLKYLDIVKEKKLNEFYNIFLPDLRNAGESSHGKTGMGYYIADDITATMIYLHDTYGINKDCVWAFSQSAMGVAVLLNRHELLDKLENKNIVLDKVILDSPLSNVFEEIRFAEKYENYKIPGIIRGIGLCMFTIDTDLYPPKMRLGNLLKNAEIPVLIFQSKEDDYTIFSIFKEEIPYFGENVELKIFEKGKHVNIYTVEENRNEYSECVTDFITKK